VKDLQQLGIVDILETTSVAKVGHNVKRKPSLMQVRHDLFPTALARLKDARYH
jgi:hypothetical protein